MKNKACVLMGVFSLLAVLPSGCGQSDGLKRAIVSGNVTFRGAPVQDGQIRFVPQADTVGPVMIAPIVNGKYRCDRGGGVPVGTHRVEVLAFDPSSSSPDGPGQPPRRQLVPAKFNRRSELTVNIAPSGEATHDFDLQER